MKAFMDNDFLLTSETAKQLFHGYAEQQPIFDYHNHLSPKDIAEHRQFRDLTELWLEGDHYKWRAMRAHGVDEAYITGNKPAYDKFLAWANVLPRLVGSPLYHWAHLELKRYFGIDEILTPRTAESVWNRSLKMIEGGGFDAVSLLCRMNVKVLCTTDDPADSLEWHKKIAEDKAIPFKVLPAFRPDKYIAGDEASCRRLCEKYGTDDLKKALSMALDHFCENGCILTDHGFSVFDYGTNPRTTELMDFLARQYSDRGLAMQLHLGPVRNASPRLFSIYGPDAGGDSVGYTTDPMVLTRFLGSLERDNALPKTILYNINPCDNSMLSAMSGNFAPKVQFGAAWWFNDNIRGIRAQIDELMEAGALASSVGMLTDSRSFTSFVRHEYYRRILCERIGELVENGEYPADLETLGSIVSDICYKNAEQFFA